MTSSAGAAGVLTVVFSLDASCWRRRSHAVMTAPHSERRESARAASLVRHGTRSGDVLRVPFSQRAPRYAPTDSFSRQDCGTLQGKDKYRYRDSNPPMGERLPADSRAKRCRAWSGLSAKDHELAAIRHVPFIRRGIWAAVQILLPVTAETGAFCGRRTGMMNHRNPCKSSLSGTR